MSDSAGFGRSGASPLASPTSPGTMSAADKTKSDRFTVAIVANDFDPSVSGLSTTTIAGETITLAMGDLARTIDGTKTWRRYGTDVAGKQWINIHSLSGTVATGAATWDLPVGIDGDVLGGFELDLVIINGGDTGGAYALRLNGDAPPAGTFTETIYQTQANGASSDASYVYLASPNILFTAGNGFASGHKATLRLRFPDPESTAPQRTLEFSVKARTPGNAELISRGNIFLGTSAAAITSIGLAGVGGMTIAAGSTWKFRRLSGGA